MLLFTPMMPGRVRKGVRMPKRRANASIVARKAITSWIVGLQEAERRGKA
jgi:hypothetical protein